MHIVGIGDKWVWHTIRGISGWEQWDGVFTSAGSLPTAPFQIACGFLMGAIHVSVATSGKLFHTNRFARGQW